MNNLKHFSCDDITSQHADTFVDAASEDVALWEYVALIVILV